MCLNTAKNDPDFVSVNKKYAADFLVTFWMNIKSTLPSRGLKYMVYCTQPTLFCPSTASQIVFVICSGQGTSQHSSLSQLNVTALVEIH